MFDFIIHVSETSNPLRIIFNHKSLSCMLLFTAHRSTHTHRERERPTLSIPSLAARLLSCTESHILYSPRHFCCGKILNTLKRCLHGRNTPHTQREDSTAHEQTIRSLACSRSLCRATEGMHVSELCTAECSEYFSSFALVYCGSACHSVSVSSSFTSIFGLWAIFIAKASSFIHANLASLRRIIIIICNKTFRDK